MSKSTNIQLRGHCPHCGRQQAIVSGRMSKHGYEVEHGYFHGVCGGQFYAPIEVDRTEADRRVVELTALSFQELEIVNQYRSGERRPATVNTNRWLPATRSYEQVPFEQGTSRQKDNAVRAAVCKHSRFATMLADDAVRLQALIDSVHGQPLIEVERAAGPEPIHYGETRTSERGTLIATSIRGGVVCWKLHRNGQVFHGRTSTRAWRALPKAVF